MEGPFSQRGGLLEPGLKGCGLGRSILSNRGRHRENAPS